MAGVIATTIGALPFQTLGISPMLRVSQQRDYGDKRARNKRIGPGGGTRRLHQNLSFGDVWGRNRIDGRLKVLAFARRDATVIGSTSIVANDNYAPVRVAA